MATTEKVTKRKVVAIATRQSQNAQALTRALRAHGWRTHYRAGERLEADAAYRREEARQALISALLVERDAHAIRTWVQSWAAGEGVDVEAEVEAVLGEVRR